MRQHTAAHRPLKPLPLRATAQPADWDDEQDDWPEKPASAEDVQDLGILDSLGRAISQPVRDAAEASEDEQLIDRAARREQG